MISDSNHGNESIVGKVLLYTFNKPGIPAKYFEVERDDRSKCFCKGKVIPGKEFSIGSTLRLYGEWKVNESPKYAGIGLQFYFDSYELISPEEFAKETAAAIPGSLAAINPLSVQEVVTGNIIRLRPVKNDYRIFRLRTEEGREFWCQGAIHREKPLYINQRVRLSGEWEVNARRPEYGLQFYFTSCDIVATGQPQKIIAQPKGTVPTGNTTTTRGELAERIADYLATIGRKKITYEFHAPKHATIAAHVRAQLDERLLKANRDDKDFFFLTALLDRRVEDERIQTFRKDNRNFKKDLLRCWKEAERALDRATDDIGKAFADADILRAISDQSPTYRALTASIPGEHGIDQLLACLKIIRDRYDRNEKVSITDFVRGIKSESEIKGYLRGIRGIGPKLSNWSLTNVTGHWFVIDDPNIKPLIQKELADTIPSELEVSAENADAIFECWFGKLNEEKKEYERFSHDQFASSFPDFPFEACEYLPFIATQYLWFYGKFYG